MAVHAESSIQLNTIPAYTSLLGGHFYYKSTEATQEHPTPPSANIIEIASTPSNPSTWGYNTHIGANGIKLRFNEVDLSSWSALNGLQLYSPTVTNGVIVDNQLGAQLTSSALTFYKPGAANLTKGLELDATTVKFYGSNQSNPDAILSSTGLKLVKGGIEAGTSGQTGFVYISSENYQLKDATHNGITINGHTPTAAGTDGKIVDDPAWREVIGTKFGVDSEGNLYASNVDIGGKITATSGAIGGWQIGTDSNKSLYYSNSTPGYSTDTLVISKYSVTNTNSIANSAIGLHWFLAAGTKFGVTTDGTLYANGANITNINGANITANTISIGTMNSEAQLAILNGKTYNIGVNNGTTGWHFLGTLTLTGQTDEAQIEIHTGSGQNNTANQNLTILVNIKRGYQASQSTTGGITVRYEGNPTIVNMGTNVCSIVVRCTTVGVMNVYLYTPTWGYADGWYQVKGRGCSWVHSGTLVTTEPSEGIAQSITVMNPYTTATSYITDISNDGIKIHDANTTSNSIVIDSNGIDIYKNNTSVAFYGETSRIGINSNSQSYVQIGTNIITMFNKGVETYKIENTTNREVKIKIDLNYSFYPGATSLSQDIELGRAVSSWINTGGVRGIVLTYDLWGDDYSDISQSYNGPTVIDTNGKYAFTSELNGSIMTITLGPGATLDGSEVIYFTSIEFNFIAADPVVYNTIGAYANNTLSSPFKIGVGTASIPSNAMLVDFSGNTKIKGDLFIKCNDDSTGGMSLGTVRQYSVSYQPSGLRHLYIDAYQVGYTVTLTIEFVKTTTTASGANYFTQVLGEIPAPADLSTRISGFGYTGSMSVGYWLAWTDGFWQLSARNLSATTASANFGLTASLTYVTDGTLCWDRY